MKIIVLKFLKTPLKDNGLVSIEDRGKRGRKPFFCTGMSHRAKVYVLNDD